MEKHTHVILHNRFGDTFFCHICGIEFSETIKLKEKIYLDLYNLLMDEKLIITSAEAVLVWVSERIKELGPKGH